MSSNQPTIVIIGGGYAGATLAAELDKNTSYRIILIEPNHYFLHSIAALRAAVQANEWSNNALFPFTSLFKNATSGSHVINARVERIIPDQQHVIVYGGTQQQQQQTIHYDHLVIATGAAYRFPGKITEPQTEHAKVLLQKVANDIANSKHIVIVGGGPVGIELAGEIASVYNSDRQNKEITLIHSHPRLLSTHLDIKDCC